MQEGWTISPPSYIFYRNVNPLSQNIRIYSICTSITCREDVDMLAFYVAMLDTKNPKDKFTEIHTTYNDP